MAKQSNMEGKFSEFLAASKAAEQENSSNSSSATAKTVSDIDTENSTDISTESKKELTLKTVTFKAPEDVRLHWVVEAKKRRTTVSKICRDSLVEQLGLPEGWNESDLS